MKKFLVITLIIATAVGVAYAAGDYLTGDPTIRKGMCYGVDSSGDPIKLLLNADGSQ